MQGVLLKKLCILDLELVKNITYNIKKRNLTDREIILVGG